MIPQPRLFDAIDGTWPAARMMQCGPWTLRDGRGGGKRVSAATTVGPVTDADIADAVRGMETLDQPPLFMVQAGQEALDCQLEELGYQIIDPVVIYACPTARLTDIAIPRVTIFPIWEPLAIMREIWASGGIGPARLAVMDRVRGPKTALLGRHKDKPAGTAFAAIYDRIAMVHAIEVLPHQRRLGMGRWFMRGAAFWAAEHGAETLAVMCTRQNTAANALYAALGMDAVGSYHYRHLPTEDAKHDT